VLAAQAIANAVPSTSASMTSLRSAAARGSQAGSAAGFRAGLPVASAVDGVGVTKKWRPRGPEVNVRAAHDAFMN